MYHTGNIDPLFDNVSKRVVRTQTGSGSSTNYWCKIANVDMNGTFNNVTLKLDLLASTIGNPVLPYSVGIGLRSNNSNEAVEAEVEFVNYPNNSVFEEDAIKVISDGYGTNFEIWMQKSSNNTRMYF